MSEAAGNEKAEEEEEEEEEEEDDDENEKISALLDKGGVVPTTEHIPDREDFLHDLESYDITSAFQGDFKAEAMETDAMIALAEITSYFEKVNLSEKEKEELFDFLAYTRIRGTEFFKVFQAIDIAGREELQEAESKVLTEFGVSGFHELMDDGAIWQRMEEHLAASHPNLKSLIPSRTRSVAELQILLDEAKTALERKEEQSIVMCGIILILQQQISTATLERSRLKR